MITFKDKEKIKIKILEFLQDQSDVIGRATVIAMCERWKNNHHRKNQQTITRGKFSKNEIKWALLQQKFLCPRCGEKIQSGEEAADHNIPVVQGGKTEPNNLVVLHKSCNNKKAAKNPIEESRATRTSVISRFVQETYGK